MKRTHHCSQLRTSDAGTSATLAGWVDSVRDHGGILFVDLRDREGLTQIVLDPSNASLEAQFGLIKPESVIEVSGAVQERIADATERTAQNSGIHFNVCTNYGGRRELVRAAQSLARQAADGLIVPEAIDENSLAAELFTRGEQDPDLLIRTSGEQRISNFLLWQLAYAEIHVTDVNWPDFDAAALKRALLDFQSRQRRFGGLETSQP